MIMSYFGNAFNRITDRSLFECSEHYIYAAHHNITFSLLTAENVF
jgi:hypothetical protein